MKFESNIENIKPIEFVEGKSSIEWVREDKDLGELKFGTQYPFSNNPRLIRVRNRRYFYFYEPSFVKEHKYTGIYKYKKSVTRCFFEDLFKISKELLKLASVITASIGLIYLIFTFF